MKTKLFILIIVICILAISLVGCGSSSNRTEDNRVCYAHIILEDGTAYDVVVKDYISYTGSSYTTWICLTLEDGSQITTSIYNVYLHTKNDNFNKVLESNKR